MEKKVSVIVPCYNVEKYVEQCLESVLSQSMEHAHYEILLIEDCSTDRTRDILKVYEEKYPDTIRLFCMEENRGIGAVRNQGIQHATGKYVVFVDSDDMIDENMLLYLTEIMENTEADMGECGFTFFSTENSGIYERQLQVFDLQQTEMCKEYIIKYGSMNAAWAKIWKRSFIQENNLYFAEGFTREDIIFYQLSIAHAHYVVHLNKELYYYRQNPNGITMGPDSMKKVFDAAYVQELAYLELWERNGFRDCYLEWEFLYFRKAFWLPYQSICEAKCENENHSMIIEVLHMTLEHWPNVLNNPYVLLFVGEDNIKKVKVIYLGK